MWHLYDEICWGDQFNLIRFHQQDTFNNIIVLLGCFKHSGVIQVRFWPKPLSRGNVWIIYHQCPMRHKHTLLPQWHQQRVFGILFIILEQHNPIHKWKRKSLKPCSKELVSLKGNSELPLQTQELFTICTYYYHSCTYSSQSIDQITETLAFPSTALFWTKTPPFPPEFACTFLPVMSFKSG